MSRTSGIFTESSGRNCRLCRKSHDYYYNIFTWNVACNIAVKDAIHDLVGLHIAVGDGLPTTMCPLCMKKLTEFSVFKKICLESDAVLRKSLQSICCRSFEGGGTADDNLGPSVETKDCIQNVIENNSQPTCSAHTTEIYLPVPDLVLPRVNELFPVKEETEDQLSEGNYTPLYASDPAGISTDASDPLASDDLSITLTASKGEKVEAQDTGAVVVDLECTLIVAKKEPCLEENAQRIQGEDTADEKLVTPVDTKDFIQDDIQGISHLTHSVQRTEIYIPVLDSQQLGSNMLETVKDENKDPLSEGNYPEIYTPDPAKFSRNALDPLATDELAQTSISSHGEEVDAEGTGAIEMDLDSMLVLAKEELSPKETGATEPAVMEIGELIQNRTMAMESMIEAEESPASKRASALFAVLEPKIRASHSRKGRKVFDKDLKKCDILIADKITLCSNPNDVRFHSKSSYASSLVHHTRTHTKIKLHSCNECDKSFPCKSHLVYHMRTHTKEKPYSCNECEKSFSRNSHLVRHYRTHTKEKPYSCNVCDKSFSDKTTLVRHIRTHTKEKPYTCDECEKSFSQKSNLICHIRTHMKEKPYSCNECDKSFSQKVTLVSHIRTHMKEKPYSCNECEKSFSRNSHLVRHYRTHTKEKPYSCDECEKSFSLNSNLVRHIRTHTKEKPYSCNECDKSFSQKITLVYHMRTHTKERPYSCNICDKSFSQKITLVNHMRTHTKERPYSCNICDKSFSRKNHLVCHIPIHMKKKPYSCSECEKYYTTKENLVLLNECNECGKTFS